jgi:hypothetical protein
MAFALWLGIVLVWAISHRGVRRSIGNLLRISIGWKLLLPAFVMAGYTTLVCWRLSVAGYWDVSLLKDTILWFCFYGLTLGFALNPGEGSPSWWRRALTDQMRVVLVLEYLANTYTFPFLVELLLQPLLVLLILVSALGRERKELRELVRHSDVVLAFFGLATLAFVAHAMLSAGSSSFGASDVRAILLPAALTVAFIPIAYLCHLLVAYEGLFLRAGFALPRDERLLRHAKWRLVRLLGVNVMAVRRFAMTYSTHWISLNTWVEVDNFLLFSSLQIKRREPLDSTTAPA